MLLSHALSLYLFAAVATAQFFPTSDVSCREIQPTDYLRSQHNVDKIIRYDNRNEGYTGTVDKRTGCNNIEELIVNTTARLLCGYTFSITSKDRDNSYICVNDTLNYVIERRAAWPEKSMICSCFAFDALPRPKRAAFCGEDLPEVIELFNSGGNTIGKCNVVLHLLILICFHFLLVHD